MRNKIATQSRVEENSQNSEKEPKKLIVKTKVLSDRSETFWAGEHMEVLEGNTHSEGVEVFYPFLQTLLCVSLPSGSSQIVSL